MGVFIIHIHVAPFYPPLGRAGRKALAFLSPSVEQTAPLSHVLLAFQSLLAAALTVFDKTKGSGGAVRFLCTLLSFYRLLLQHRSLVAAPEPLPGPSHNPRPPRLNPAPEEQREVWN